MIASVTEPRSSTTASPSTKTSRQTRTSTCQTRIKPLPSGALLRRLTQQLTCQLTPAEVFKITATPPTRVTPNTTCIRTIRAILIQTAVNNRVTSSKVITTTATITVLTIISPTGSSVPSRTRSQVSQSTSIMCISLKLPSERGKHFEDPSNVIFSQF